MIRSTIPSCTSSFISKIKVGCSSVSHMQLLWYIWVLYTWKLWPVYVGPCEPYKCGPKGLNGSAERAIAKMRGVWSSNPFSLCSPQKPRSGKFWPNLLNQIWVHFGPRSILCILTHGPIFWIRWAMPIKNSSFSGPSPSLVPMHNSTRLEETGEKQDAYNRLSMT